MSKRRATILVVIALIMAAAASCAFNAITTLIVLWLFSLVT